MTGLALLSCAVFVSTCWALLSPPDAVAEPGMSEAAPPAVADAWSLLAALPAEPFLPEDPGACNRTDHVTSLHPFPKKEEGKGRV